MFGWVKRFFRKRMPYMEPHQARSINEKLSFIYAAFSWNVIGLTVYWIFKQNVPRTPIDSVDYAKLLGIHDATVIKFSGLKKVVEYDFHLEEEEVEKFHTKPEPETTEEKELSQNENTTVVE